MARFMPLAALAVYAVTAGTALASPKDYCEAYARDFADRGPKDETVWKARRSNALSDCLLQFLPAEATDNAVPEQPKQNKKAAKTQVAKAKQKVEPPPQEAADEPLPEPAVIVAPDIEPPVKSAQTGGAAKKKTLFAKIFPPKDGAASTASPTEDGKLVPGSAAWLDYCDRKYASFNRETGTYKSYKGIERKCLVTN